MIHGKKIVVVLPAYQAEKTIERTFQEIPKDVIDHILMVDDASNDKTVEVASPIGDSNHRSRTQPRIRWEPKDLLSGGIKNWSRYCYYASPGLPV